MATPRVGRMEMAVRAFAWVHGDGSDAVASSEVARLDDAKVPWNVVALVVSRLLPCPPVVSTPFEMRQYIAWRVVVCQDISTQWAFQPAEDGVCVVGDTRVYWEALAGYHVLGSDSRLSRGTAVDMMLRLVDELFLL